MLTELGMTRRERSDLKIRSNRARTYPISIATVNFIQNKNLGTVIRAAGCFGAEAVYVIGSLPSITEINRLSGTLYDYVNLKCFSNPRDFLEFTLKNNIRLISAELTSYSKSIYDYKFNFSSRFCIVVGNETSGVPEEILLNSEEVISIPMPGVGNCMNTAQVANVMLYQATRQFEGY